MLTEQEIGLLEYACKVYLQLARQELPPDGINKLSGVIDGIFVKIKEANAGTPISKPKGISDEWFDGVCKGCVDLKGTQCSNTVTAKFPGKCDPILKFERLKFLAEKKAKEGTPKEVTGEGQILKDGAPTNIIDSGDKFKKGK